MIYLPKSSHAPASLAVESAKPNGDYRGEDVLLLLREDFKNKCYLCETKEPHDINVEHFIPHKGNLTLKFDWNNLFFACPHCNGTKLETVGILNCTTDPDCDKRHRYSIGTPPSEAVAITHPLKIVNIVSIDSSAIAETTAVLLGHIYNGTTALKKLESENLRKTLLRSVKEFKENLIAYYENTSATFQARQALHTKIISELKNDSAFTAFKRWIIRDDAIYLQDFPESEWS